MDVIRAGVTKETRRHTEELVNPRWFEQISTLIKLRWFAVFGLFAVITISWLVLKIELPLRWLYSVNLVLLFANIIFFKPNSALINCQGSLAAIQSCLAVVSGNKAGDISQTAREMIGRAENRCQQLLKFVKELLELSRKRMHSDILLEESVCLIECLSSLGKQLEARITEKGLTLNTNILKDSICVSISKNDLDHVIWNLLSNAVRYTPEGGSIDLSVKEHAKTVEVIVRDTGIGIHEDDMESIFKDVFRAKNAVAVNQERTGSGLAIVKHIIDSYGGESVLRAA